MTFESEEPKGTRYNVGAKWPNELLYAKGTVWVMGNGQEAPPVPRDAELVRRTYSPHHTRYIIIPDEAQGEEPKSLRDEFAMAALSLATDGIWDITKFSAVAERAYQIADAMLAERRKERSE